MTTQKLSSERLLDGALWRNMNRRRTAHILVAFLVTFFCVAVPLMMELPKIPDPEVTLWTIEECRKNAADDMFGTMVLHLVASVALSVYFAVITLGYMMKRRSAHFYHALPQRRETLYTTSVASAIFCAAVGGAIALGVALIVVATNGFFCAPVLTVFFRCLAKNVVYFLIFYAIALFVGSVSGTSLVQVLMTGMAMFWPLATYAGMIGLASLYTTYFDQNYYISGDVIRYLSPVTYMIFTYDRPLNYFVIAVAALLFIVLFLGGMQIYVHRKMENAEQTIVFPKLGRVLMYMLLFTTTLFAGLFFAAIAGNEWIFFGFISGAVLGFMLYNTILAKTPKAMFKGIKGFVIFLVVFAVYFVMFGMDVFHTDEKVFTPRSADITVNGLTAEKVKITDPEMLDALTDLLRAQTQNPQGSNRSRYSGFSLRVVLYTDLGYPVARHYWISTDDPARENFLRKFADDPVFEEQLHNIEKALIEPNAGKTVSAELSVYYAGAHYSGLISDFAELMEIYFAELGEVCYDRFSQPAVGSFNAYSFRVDASYLYRHSEYINDFPIYIDMEKTVDYLEKHLKADDLREKGYAYEDGYYIPETMSDFPADVILSETFETTETAEKGKALQFVDPYTYRLEDVRGGRLLLRQYEDDGNTVIENAFPITLEQAKEIWQINLLSGGNDSISRIFVAWERGVFVEVDLVNAVSASGEEVTGHTVYIPKVWTPDFVKAYTQ